MKTIPEFKIRCSAIGKIMTSPRKKGEVLSETTKTYLKEWLTEQLYSKRKEVKSKYLDKGIQNEDFAIEMASTVLDWGFAVKNKERRTNDYTTGEPDLVFTESIEDIKCSWDCFTFPLFDEELKNKDYEWQLQGYMWLFDKPSSGIVYVLTDTPEDIIVKEADILASWSGKSLEEAYNEVSEKHTYEVDLKYRVKRFQVDRDEEKIEAIKNRVLECREYLNDLISKL
jgi:hypothetical protein